MVGLAGTCAWSDGPGEYKRMMDHADMPRQGDLDGRGNLSQRALTEYTLWFLQVCLDQVTFMSTLFEIETLAQRLRSLVERSEQLKPEAAGLLEEALIRGNSSAAKFCASPACPNVRRAACSMMLSASVCLPPTPPRARCRCAFLLMRLMFCSRGSFRKPDLETLANKTHVSFRHQFIPSRARCSRINGDHLKFGNGIAPVGKERGMHADAPPRAICHAVQRASPDFGHRAH